MTDQDHDEPTTAELVPYTAPRTVDLRNAATDSWTDVLEQVADLAVKIAGTEFVPQAYRGKPGQVAAVILHGREIGFPPMTALANTHSIEGKPATSAEGMRALVLQAGHEILVTESSGSRVVMQGRRRGTEEWTPVTWTLEDARRAGLGGPTRSGKPSNWMKYPRQMLAARATAELCRLVFPDVIHGLRAAEELMDEIDHVTPTGPAEEPAAKTTTVRRRNTRKKTDPKPEPTADEPAEDPKPPARKRAELPTPRPRPRPPEGETTGPAQGDPDAGAGPVEQQQDQSEEPAAPAPDQADTEDSGEAAEVSTGRATGPQLTAGQRASVIMHFTRLDVDDRDERLWWTNHFLGLEEGTIGSTNELRQAEAVALLGKLERFKDRDQLDASLNQSELIPEDDDARS